MDAWSSTGTLSSLPDAQWNAAVRPKFALGKLTTKMLPPQHLFLSIYFFGRFSSKCFIYMFL
jgi:hypothetical protein